VFKSFVAGVLSFCNRALALPALAVALVVSMVSEAQAAVPAEITGLLTDVDTVFADVKITILAIVGFFLLLWIVKKVRGK